MTVISDAIQYSDPFKIQVGGRLAARFRLDPDGRPVFVRYSEDRRLLFYTIDLLLKGPYTGTISKVSYRMNHPSFEDDPVISSEDVDNEFPAEIETYGDIEIVVTAHVNGKKLIQRAWLSQMLTNSYGSPAKSEVKDAIERIKAF
jgi:hypothetical protein